MVNEHLDHFFLTILKLRIHHHIVGDTFYNFFFFLLLAETVQVMLAMHSPPLGSYPMISVVTFKSRWSFEASTAYISGKI